MSKFWKGIGIIESYASLIGKLWTINIITQRLKWRNWTSKETWKKTTIKA